MCFDVPFNGPVMDQNNHHLKAVCILDFNFLLSVESSSDNYNFLITEANAVLSLTFFYSAHICSATDQE